MVCAQNLSKTKKDTISTKRVGGGRSRPPPQGGWPSAPNMLANPRRDRPCSMETRFDARCELALAPVEDHELLPNSLKCGLYSGGYVLAVIEDHELLRMKTTIY